MSEISNASPLVIGKHPNQKKLKRRFLGNLFPKNSIEVKELKGYVMGHSRYAHGRDSFGYQMYYPVRQEYYYE